MNEWEVADFCKEIAIMVRAGMTLEEALEFMRQDSQENTYDEIIKEIKIALQQKKTIDQAIQSTGKFPKYMIAIIQIGLITNRLDEALEILIRVYEREAQIKASLKRVVFYPLYLMSMLCIVEFLLVLKVLPVFEAVFKNWEGQMTEVSTALVNLGSFINKGTTGLFIFLIILVGTFSFLKLKKSKKINSWLLNYMRISERKNEARLAWTMSLLLRSGFNIEVSLRQSFNVVENKVVQERLKKCLKLVAEKHIFDEALIQSKLFPKQSTNFIVNGFKHGQLSEALKQISEKEERSIQYTLENKVMAIETFSVGITSFIIAGILMTIMLPLISIISML